VYLNPLRKHVGRRVFIQDFVNLIIARACFALQPAGYERNIGSLQKEKKMSNPLPNKDQVEGKLKQAEGRARDAKGDLTNDASDDVAGKAKQAEGKAQELLGNAKKAIHEATR
jgi:uncharacterized protein YjbJ (UPF0337 family)